MANRDDLTHSFARFLDRIDCCTDPDALCMSYCSFRDTLLDALSDQLYILRGEDPAGLDVPEWVLG